MVKYLVILAAIGAFFAGYKWCENDYLEAQNDLKDQLKEKQARITELGFKVAEAEANIRVEYKEKEIEVIRYVENTPIVDCFNDGAVRLFNETASPRMSETP